MRYLLTLVAALMLVTVAFTATAQAQQRTVRTQQRAHTQPRAFTKRFKNQVARNTRTHVKRTRPRTVSPRFYHSNAASRASQRLRYRTRRAPTRARARANISPRRNQPRFFNPGSASHHAKRLRHSRARAAQARRATLRRPRPTFWK